MPAFLLQNKKHLSNKVGCGQTQLFHLSKSNNHQTVAATAIKPSEN